MSMTPEQFNAKFQAKIKDLEIGKVIYWAATATHDMMVRRIFDEGVKGDETPIGTYSTKEMYASKKQFVKGGAFAPQGKFSKKPFANGAARKTMFLALGYKQLRDIQGRQTNKVDLTYSGDLRRDVATKLVVDGNFVLSKVSRDINQKKIAGLSAKYGNTLFKHTQEEIEFFAKNAAEDITEYLRA